MRTTYKLQGDIITSYHIYLVIDMFCDYGFPYKQLMYYLKKWDRKGFYEYGVGISYGWFIVEKIPVEYLSLITKI